MTAECEKRGLTLKSFLKMLNWTTPKDPWLLVVNKCYILMVLYCFYKCERCHRFRR